jgi:hypothetical protein
MGGGLERRVRFQFDPWTSMEVHDVNFTLRCKFGLFSGPGALVTYKQ